MIFIKYCRNVEERFCTSNYELHTPFPKGKNKKGIGLLKDKLDGKIMKEFVELKAKTSTYLTSNNDENKKAKDTKNCFNKSKIKFKDYKHCLEVAQTENKKTI